MMPMRLVGMALLLCGVTGCSTVRGPVAESLAAKPLSMDPGDWSSVHPLEKPKPHVEQWAAAVSQDVKDHTYLFFINGLDPYYLANFRGQCQYLKSLGYNNAYLGQMNQVELFRKFVKQVRTDDPRAQIVIVGYSLGANCARTLANQLRDDGVGIDLLVYLGGDTIMNVSASRPANVARLLNINAHGSILLGMDLFVNGSDIDGASNHRLAARHFLLPTRAECTELLVRHVVELNRAK